MSPLCKLHLPHQGKNPANLIFPIQGILLRWCLRTNVCRKDRWCGEKFKAISYWWNDNGLGLPLGDRSRLLRDVRESFWFIVFRWFSSWFYGNIHGHLEKFVNGIDMSFWSFLLLGRRQEKEAEHSVEKPLKMSHFMFFRLCLFIWIFVDILGSFRSTMASVNIEIKICREND